VWAYPWQKWAQIKTLLPGRTGHALKNRYHSLRRRTRQKRSESSKTPTSSTTLTATSDHVERAAADSTYQGMSGCTDRATAAAAAAAASAAAAAVGTTGLGNLQLSFDQWIRQRALRPELQPPADSLGALSALHVPPTSFNSLAGLVPGQGWNLPVSQAGVGNGYGALPSFGALGFDPRLGPSYLNQFSPAALAAAAAAANSASARTGLAQLAVPGSGGKPTPSQPSMERLSTPSVDHRNAICMLSAQLLSLAEMGGGTNTPVPIMRRLIDERLSQLRSTVLSGGGGMPLQGLAPRVSMPSADCGVPSQLAPQGGEHGQRTNDVPEYDEEDGSPFEGLAAVPSLSALDELDAIGAD